MVRTRSGSSSSFHNVDVLAFDLDGTLIDSMPQHEEAFADIVADMWGIEKHNAAAHYRRTAGRSLAAQFREAAPTSIQVTEVRLQELSREFIRRIMATRPNVFDDALVVLPRLKAAGFMMAVTSGGPSDLVEEKIKKAGLTSYFGVALGTDDRRRMVKGAAHFRIIRDHFALSASEFVERAAFIGDSPYDMRLAKRNHILAIGRTGYHEGDLLTRSGADIVVSSLTELSASLEF